MTPILDPEMTGPAMPGSKIAVARGPAGTPLDMLVYKTVGTDVTTMYLKLWDRRPLTIPVGTL